MSQLRWHIVIGKNTSDIIHYGNNSNLPYHATILLDNYVSLRQTPIPTADYWIHMITDPIIIVEATSNDFILAIGAELDLLEEQTCRVDWVDNSRKLDFYWLRDELRLYREMQVQSIENQHMISNLYQDFKDGK